MRRNEPITHIMTKGPAAVQVGQPVSEVSRLMKGGGFHHVPVLEGDRLVGIITATDVLRVSYTHGADERQTDAVLDHTVSLSDIMTTDVATLRSTATVREAVEVFAEGDVHSLPVVDQQGHLVGIVTTTDALRYLRDQY